jgi:hypothetical protein
VFAVSHLGACSAATPTFEKLIVLANKLLHSLYIASSTQAFISSSERNFTKSQILLLHAHLQNGDALKMQRKKVRCRLLLGAMLLTPWAPHSTLLEEFSARATAAWFDKIELNSTHTSKQRLANEREKIASLGSRQSRTIYYYLFEHTPQFDGESAASTALTETKMYVFTHNCDASCLNSDSDAQYKRS